MSLTSSSVVLMPRSLAAASHAPAATSSRSRSSAVMALISTSRIAQLAILPLTTSRAPRCCSSRVETASRRLRADSAADSSA
ncbi:Os01g0109432 [Oryza sativa Japonica Group]|uniref:Os01g0109432 protein n=1 Tax=Oryza sativa subsp. japonica TaxID=39947 RepID=A0A0P0UXB2_ORYSJ|nr:hypothetical protein EE612_004352 [Oryza sativa]BAS69999.1 Os01g0109432 [Oryza sativa Japonica Group]